MVDPALSNEAFTVLKKYWGFDSFRKGQEKAITAVLGGRDTFVVLPTGGGKSLCYQVPAVIKDGLALVISPLIALMEDQVSQLNNRGISAAAINSTQSMFEVEQHLVNARNNMYNLLYCSPERLESPIFQNELRELPLSIVAIDEAHCISEWGHQFRPSYRRIRDALQQIDPTIPWIALTATATQEVRKDILELLALRDPEILVGGFDRPNLQWWIRYTERKREKLVEMVKRAEREPGAGLIYTGTRRSSEDLARILRNNGFTAEAYHAGLPAEKRQQIQKDWLEDNLTWVVSTNAFGMGIDKKDCRYVFHYMMPSSIEAYYQEAGRAGRDGEPAFPVLLYKESDYHKIRGMIEHNYPGKNELNRIYSALCDSFDIAVGSEMEEPEQVDLHDLSLRSDLPEKRILAGLKVLSTLSLVELITNYQPEIGIKFIVGQDAIIDFVSNTGNAAKGEFVDHLYRLLGPESLHRWIFLKCDYLLDKLEITKNKLIKGLAVLQREQFLLFEDRANKPLTIISGPRYERLPYTAKQLEWYRSILLEKLQMVHGYVHTRECRSRYIRTYFGETDVPRFCGKCDNCLNILQNDHNLKAENIRRCYELISESPKTSEDLIKYSGYSVGVVKHILKILLREELISDSPDDPGVFEISK